jgi:asparagine synthase (glutamine-hydrolysing)
VALSGLGGDEMAGVYERYLGVLLGRYFRAIPGVLRRQVARAVGLLPDMGGRRRFSMARLKRFLASAQEDPAFAYADLISTFSAEEMTRLLAAEAAKEARQWSCREMVAELFRKSESDATVNQMLYSDLHGYLAGDLLPLSDRMSMLHSLEVRVPLVDHELLEYMATVPPELKIRGMEKKHILRKAAERWLGPETLNREKRGFSIPLAFWLREQLNGYVREQLAPERVARMGYLNPAEVSRILEEHFAARANHENKIWALLNLALWHELYLEGGRKAATRPQAAVWK